MDLLDTLGILLEATGGAAPALLTEFQIELEAACNSRPATLAAAHQCLDGLTARAEAFAASFAAGSETDADGWARALARQCRANLNELLFLAPWLALPAAPSRLVKLPDIAGIPTLNELSRFDEQVLPVIDQQLQDKQTPEERDWLMQLRPLIHEASRRALERIAAIESLAHQSGELACMQYDFLFDKPRRLLAIGYNVSERQRDTQLLRSAGFGSAVVQFCGDCSGTSAARELVCLGKAAGDYRRRAHSAVMERFHVRILDAAPGDAEL